MPSPRNGFTIVELMVTIVVLGILSSIALPRYTEARDKALMASMKTDLHNLIAVEEGYYHDNDTYVGGTATNVGATQTPVSTFLPSSNVQVVITANGAGWTAVATHTTTSRSCAIFIGGTPVAPATVEGEPTCR